ncbi:uncharacterized protein LOC120012477 [Tripterygium wilfordii]|uniref:uncharacterized protein LOC120012477 n=1 Tax=Tripterygium wilfordii TaxID=458696 RepID=UPI0018F859B8|nr:uncharacterized protein LOC120012477 [Tripterygium wilfordii]
MANLENPEIEHGENALARVAAAPAIDPVRRPMKNSFVLQNLEQPSSIAFQPNFQGNITFPPNLLNVVPHFRGTSSDDPYLHIREFFELCKTQHVQGLTPEELRLLLFPFSLKDNAKLWFNSLAPGSITTWEQMATKFLKKFFPAQKTKKLRREIQTWQQKDGDLFYKAWDDFKQLLLKCPHHNLSQDDQVQAFYEGLDANNTNIVDSACGGVLMEKSSEEAFDLFEILSENSQQFSSRGKQGLKLPRGVYEVHTNAEKQPQLLAMEKKIDMLVKAFSTQNIGPIQQTISVEVYAICSQTSHTTEMCPMSSFSEHEHVNYAEQGGFHPNNNPFSNTYNPGWRNHPNFSWGGQNQNQNKQYNQNAQQVPTESKKPSLEEQMALLALNTNNFMQKVTQQNSKYDQQFSNTQASIQKLEVQVGQIAKQLSERVPGRLPSQAEINPKDKEQLNAITTRSGITVGYIEKDEEKDENEQENGRQQELKEENQTKAAIPLKVEKSEPHVPFPSRLVNEKKTEQMRKVMDIFRKVEINIPLLDAIQQIPSYAKFLKDVCTSKRKLAPYEKVMLSEQCSAVLNKKLPPKLKDPGSFSIPCIVGQLSFEKAFLDLGASINLMPYSVFMQLGLEKELQPTSITLQLADRSIKFPRGIIEDVLVQVDKFLLPTDFIILDMEELSWM